MPRKSLPTRLAAVAALLLTTGALSTPAASASSAHSADAAPGDAYVLTVSTDPATTDHDHRRVDVTGTVTKADGTPAPHIPVTVEEVVRFTTWNPWGDPIDPTYYEPRELGRPVSDADGRFTIPDVDIDHVGTSSLLNVQQGVQITAFYDEDGDLNTPQDGYFADTTVTADARPSSVTYTVNRKRLKAGDILVVQGRVALPQGVEPGDTEVFLQTYWEGQYRVRTTTRADGTFMLLARVRDYDDTFTLRTAPRDMYVSGAIRSLPVTNTSLPRG
ncbi:acyl carrier protein [Streptomyces sp. NPDC057620]|uniref:Acyl carrier protein n=1 Tax=Streptomyces liliiviolaceus TaxID=2823109 RepID=A0A940XRU3_9ACTN|nr:acyl carrier protein [Streptomyces liliiviolaceus]MBQ0849377.1 acyl carrier protein [Streptomyces liliiviolaceus]